MKIRTLIVIKRLKEAKLLKAVGTLFIAPVTSCQGVALASLISFQPQFEKVLTAPRAKQL